MSKIYNLLPYGGTSEGAVSKDRQVTFFGNLNSFTGTVTILHRSTTFTGAFRGRTVILSLIMRTAPFLGSLYAELPIILMVFREIGYMGIMGSEISLNFIRTPRRIFGGSLNANVSINSLQMRSSEFSGQLEGEINISLNIHRRILYFGTLGAFIDVMEIIIEEATINVLIPVGGKLVIDTERFTAYLDGENVIHLYDGAWPRIFPEIVSLQIGLAEGSDMSGEITFKERYL